MRSREQHGAIGGETRGELSSERLQCERPAPVAAPHFTPSSIWLGGWSSEGTIHAGMGSLACVALPHVDTHIRHVMWLMQLRSPGRVNSCVRVSDSSFLSLQI